MYRRPLDGTKWYMPNDLGNNLSLPGKGRPFTTRLSRVPGRNQHILSHSLPELQQVNAGPAFIVPNAFRSANQTLMPAKSSLSSRFQLTVQPLILFVAAFFPSDTIPSLSPLTCLRLPPHVYRTPFNNAVISSSSIAGTSYTELLELKRCRNEQTHRQRRSSYSRDRLPCESGGHWG